MDNLDIKWILVAGTGKFELPDAVNWMSREIGKAIASNGFGLVVGGWKGVDYVVAQAFAEELRQQRKGLSEYLIQVIPEGTYPEFRGGHIVTVEKGVKEWIESVRYSNAVILIGGLGGTYETYQFALQEQKPTWPVAGTEGDARRAFNDIMEHWNLQPIQEIQQELFLQKLTAPINSQDDAHQLSREILELIIQNIKQEEKKNASRRDRIFISYSHRDKRWLDKLRLMLKPLERLNGFYIWDDSEIEAGQKWKDEINNALESTKVAIFLVSPNFVASQFISDNELPPLLLAAEKNHVSILWIYISACLHEETGLTAYQAAHDVSRPLDRLSPARQNEVLVGIAKAIKKTMERD